MKRGYNEKEPLYKRLLFVFLHLIYRYEQRNERPKRNTVVFVIPFNSQSLLTEVPYLLAIAPSVSPDLIRC